MLLLVLLFTDHPTAEIYTLSLHDALPISAAARALAGHLQAALRRAMGEPHRPFLAGVLGGAGQRHPRRAHQRDSPDRKSTRLNSSHLGISYAVFCLKKKNKKKRVASN